MEQIVRNEINPKIIKSNESKANVVSSRKEEGQKRTIGSVRVSGYWTGNYSQ